MIFQLRKIDDIDFFILCVKNASNLGDLLHEGTFDEIFAFAQNLAINFTDFNIDYEDKLNVSNIQENACYVVDLNNLYQMNDINEIKKKGVIYIIITSDDTLVSLPTKRLVFKSSLTNVFKRLFSYIKNIIDVKNY